MSAFPFPSLVADPGAGGKAYPDQDQEKVPSSEVGLEMAPSLEGGREKVRFVEVRAMVLFWVGGQETGHSSGWVGQVKDLSVVAQATVHFSPGGSLALRLKAGHQGKAPVKVLHEAEEALAHTFAGFWVVVGPCLSEGRGDPADLSFAGSPAVWATRDL